MESKRAGLQREEGQGGISLEKMGKKSRTKAHADDVDAWGPDHAQEVSCMMSAALPGGLVPPLSQIRSCTVASIEPMPGLRTGGSLQPLL